MVTFGSTSSEPISASVPARAGARNEAASSPDGFNRKGSWLFADRHTEEEEFFAPQQQHQRGRSLAGIAAQSVLVRRAFGLIAFHDANMEREWLKCVVAPHTAARAGSSMPAAAIATCLGLLPSPPPPPLPLPLPPPLPLPLPLPPWLPLPLPLPPLAPPPPLPLPASEHDAICGGRRRRSLSSLPSPAFSSARSRLARAGTRGPSSLARSSARAPISAACC